MPILGLGVSYRRASVELLERLAFVDEEYAKAYRRLADLEPVSESVILSTCNRVEVYAEVSSYHAGFLALKRFLFESREVQPDDFAEPLYSHYEEDAAVHLFDVASGIDSMVLGEPQILSQVRQAYHRAEAEGATGPMLSALFRGAIRTGKRARAETAIGAAPGALVEAGTALAERALDGLAGKSALVVGAGGLILIASILIVIYLSIRFNYKFAIAAILALLHDVFVLTGIWSILGRVFNSPLAASTVHSPILP